MYKSMHHIVRVHDVRPNLRLQLTHIHQWSVVLLLQSDRLRLHEYERLCRCCTVSGVAPPARSAAAAAATAAAVVTSTATTADSSQHMRRPVRLLRSVGHVWRVR